jgi:mannan endo-1,4-beta-mannosidase
LTTPTRPHPSAGHQPGDILPLSPGDQPRLSAVTRIIWGSGEVMDALARPGGHARNALIALQRNREGTLDTVILIREGLSVPVRRAEIKRLRAELHKAGATRMAAWTVVTADGLRRLGWGYLRLRTAGAASDVRAAAWQHLGATAFSAGLAILGGGAAVAIAAGGGGTGAAGIGSPAWHREHPVHVTLPVRPLAYLGAYEATSPGGYSGMETFARTCGRQPNLALYYSGWFERFQSGFAKEAAGHGAIPLVQINPVTGAGPGIPGQPVQLAAIAAGAYDSYLISYADQVASYDKAVVIGFGHEMNSSKMNGGPNLWGHGQQKASDFVAAWQHIVDVFRQQGAYNVTWLWTVNRDAPSVTGPLASWWPGSAYVTWVGVDGYYQSTDDTWDSVFGPTIAQIRKVTRAPLLISETAIGPANTEPWQLDEMYASIRQGGLLGLVWYDKNESAYLSYRLEGDPKDSAVFRQLTKPWRLIHQRAAKPEATGAQPVQPVAGGSGS